MFPRCKSKKIKIGNSALSFKTITAHLFLPDFNKLKDLDAALNAILERIVKFGLAAFSGGVI